MLTGADSEEPYIKEKYLSTVKPAVKPGFFARVAASFKALRQALIVIWGL